MLNYDSAFLYLLASAQSVSTPIYREERCPVSPFKKKRFALDTGREFAAAVNLLLAVENLRDDFRDDKKRFAGILSKFYGRAYARAKERFSKTALLIQEQLGELADLEAQGSSDTDRVADTFGALLGGIFRETGEAKEVLYQMGYNIGRWIYLVDAYEDIEKDLKTGSYNPYIKRYGISSPEDKTDSLRDEVAFSLNCSLAQAAAAYDLLDVYKHGAILENILQRGLYKKTETILAAGRGTQENGSI